MTERKKPIPVASIEVVKAQTSAVRRFTTIPDEVDAIQFKGWSNAPDIFTWWGGVLYVPQGYSHPLRTVTEYDSDSGKVLEDAPEFLVVTSSGGVFRVDIGSWFVQNTKDKTMNISFDEDFKAKYIAKTIA